ncbi:MAG: hypothetical protein GX630_08235 [Actinobacteria bacterium]|nr:hypothetical protein [Actinomycetota bacterium]
MAEEPNEAGTLQPDPDNLESQAGTANSSDLKHIHGVVATRRTAHDTLMWQTPAVVFAGEAFLFTLALQADSTRVARIIAAVLALVVALVALQTFAKHRANELTDSLTLERIERELRLGIGQDPTSGCRADSSVFAHSEPSRRAKAIGNCEFVHWYVRVPSHRLWASALVVVALAAVATIVIAAAFPDLLSGSSSR